MNKRKNIDHLFQEKFKAFEVKPSEEIWGNIEAKLDEKKQKRIIPFWWKFSSVAAVLLIVFLVSKSFYNGEVNKENSVVNETNFNKTKEGNIKQLNNNNGIKTENPVATDNNSDKKKETNAEDSTKKELQNNDLTVEAVVTNSKEIKSNSVLEKNKSKKTIYSSKSSVSEIKNSNGRSLKNKSNLEENKTTITQSVFEKSQNQVAQSAKDDKKEIAVKEVAQPKIRIENKISVDTKNIHFDSLKESINLKLTQETVKKENDTFPKNSVVSNALEELLNEKESKLKQESKRNRWQLTSNVAPIFLGSISNGSPIDSTLSKNSKSFNTNVGFGIGASYAVNKKLSVRTGLNKVNMSYDTNDILFFTGIQTNNMKNVTPTASSAMIQIQSNASNATTNLLSENELLSFENLFVRKNSGYLNQEIGYLEMPMEVNYTLLDKKFGITVIGGFSTLFLQDNRITIVSDGRNTLLGEANNLNDINFSTNLGLGIKYGFMKSFEFTIEPTFKYQLNTFSSDAGNFRPYIFGIYSGLSYKF